MQLEAEDLRRAYVNLVLVPAVLVVVHSHEERAVRAGHGRKDEVACLEVLDARHLLQKREDVARGVCWHIDLRDVRPVTEQHNGGRVRHVRVWRGCVKVCVSKCFYRP